MFEKEIATLQVAIGLITCATKAFIKPTYFLPRDGSMSFVVILSWPNFN